MKNPEKKVRRLSQGTHDSVPFRERCLWTVVALFVYLVCCQIPLYGIANAASSDPLYWLRAITGSNRFVSPSLT